jgi:5-methyltetrahydrofolate--homocysteine methyltransferase
MVKLNDNECIEYFSKRVLNNNDAALTDDVKKNISMAVKMLNENATCGYVYREFIPTFTDNKVFLQGTNVTLDGYDINKHLSGAESIYIFVATIGYGIDRIIKVSQYTNLTLSYYLDVLAGVYIEKLCDNINKEIASKVNGKDITQRFSCGYGDFPLESQKDMLLLTNAEKELGIKLTDGNMMTPFKTVSAVIGVGKKGNLDRCAMCPKREYCKGVCISD